MYQEHRNGDYLISTDPRRLDLDVIHGYLSESSYWAAGRAREVVARALRHSLCFGVYRDGQQIGFARVVSDFATFAWLADVFILDAHQSAGLGKWLIDCVLRHPDLQGLRRFLLATKDAHGLYRQFSFEELTTPERYMERFDPRA